jgi:hypothetical protein
MNPRRPPLPPLWVRLKPRCSYALFLLLAGMLTAPSTHAETLLIRARHLLDVEQGRVLNDQAIRVVDATYAH